MLRVGDFSKLANVTVKTLRHYDELGLLRPVWTDRFTGYRYYNLDQLPRLNRILALKDLGFSLEQVRRLLDSELPPDELRRMFAQKQTELAEQVRAEQERLRRVDQRIRQIESEGRLPVKDVMLKSVPAMWIASLRSVVPSSVDLPVRMAALRAELNEWSQRRGLWQSGTQQPVSWMTLYHHNEFRPNHLHIEAVLALPEEIKPGRQAGGGVEVRLLPGVETMACLLQPAGFENLQESFTTLFTWSEQQGYLRRTPLREVVLTDPTQKEAGAQFIEVQLPLESLQNIKHKLLFHLHRKENDMEPKIVTLTDITVVGLPWVGLPGGQGIPETWDVFNQRCREIKHIAANSPAYGVCSMLPNGTQGEFEYTPSFAVDRVEDVPEGMVVRQVPSGQYAVFSHVGPLDTLKATYEYIYQVWIPQSGYKVASGIDFELYGPEFVDGAPDSKFYIYIPVK